MIPLKGQYYSSLDPFRAWFLRGLPIITWHKLGPCPRGARLKGLYLSASLFDRQLAELRQAGFGSGSLDRPPSAEGSDQREVVLTFDDGYTNVLEHGQPLLAKHGFHAIQFLVANRLGQTNDWDVVLGEKPESLMDAAQVRDWLAAGHEIGSHTLSHPMLTRVPPPQAREEISASKKQLEDLFGRSIDHFCYPYGDWNPQVRDWVREAGYQTACTTDFGVHVPSDSLLELKRVTARYPSRNLKALGDWFRRRFQRRAAK